jgi:Domain of unknown function (DUF1963)
LGEITEDERKRLDGLIEKYGLGAIAAEIVGLAEPCIALALADPPDERPDVWPEPPLGASRIGGAPDLPPGWNWPANENGFAGFMLQIAMRDIPEMRGFPLPRTGMLYLFCWDDCRAVWDPPGWELRWWDGDPSLLQRSERPDGFCTAEGSFFELSDPYPIVMRPGIDLPPKSQGDWDFVNDLDRRFRATGAQSDVVDRYFALTEEARDPGATADAAKGRGPFFYPAGQLFGRTDRHLRHCMAMVSNGQDDRVSDYNWRRQNEAALDRDGAVWRQVIQIASNPATTYMSPADAAPVYILARDDGARPWAPFGPIHGFASK